MQDQVEAISQTYADRHGIARTDDWLMLKLNEEVGELTQAYLAMKGQSRDRGHTSEGIQRSFRAELADVLAQTLLLAERFGVDLEREVDGKWLVWGRE